MGDQGVEGYAGCIVHIIDVSDIIIHVHTWIEDMKGLFQGEPPEEHDARLVYDYFYLLNDWDARDAVGVASLKEMVDTVEGITSLDW